MVCLARRWVYSKTNSSSLLFFCLCVNLNQVKTSPSQISQQFYIRKGAARACNLSCTSHCLMNKLPEYGTNECANGLDISRWTLCCCLLSQLETLDDWCQFVMACQLMNQPEHWRAWPLDRAPQHKHQHTDGQTWLGDLWNCAFAWIDLVGRHWRKKAIGKDEKQRGKQQVASSCRCTIIQKQRKACKVEAHRAVTWPPQR